MASQEDVTGEGFEILDHAEPKPPGPEGKDAPETGAEEQAQADDRDLHPIDVYALLRVTIVQLASVAWQKMGLQADPFTNTIVKDLAQARLAIDAAAALIEKFRPSLQGQEARDYDTLLTDLRLNFVKQSGENPKRQ